jgi:hypothetical protein
LQKETTSRIQVLTLIVLVGILACLVIIIAQNNMRIDVVSVSDSENPPIAAEPTPIEPPVAEPQPVAQPLRRSFAVARQTNSLAADRWRYSESSSEAVIRGGVSVALSEVYPSEPRIVQSSRIKRGGTAGTLDGGLLAGKGAILKGKVLLMSAPPAEVPISFGMSAATCGAYNPTGATTRHYIVSPNGGLANVVVYIKSGLENYTFPTPTEPAIIEDFGCFFEPYVSAAQVGQKIRFRNLDSFMHNIHCTPKNNREFSFAQPVAGMTNERTFDTPELFVRIKCDVHEWEFAYISALPHPFFAVSDQDGNYRLPRGLPPGNYNVGAYHAKAGELTDTIEVRPTTYMISNSFRFQLPPRLSGL